MDNENIYGGYTNGQVLPDSQRKGLAIAEFCISLINFIVF